MKLGGKMRKRSSTILISIIFVSFLLCCIIYPVDSQGNAEISRKRNLNLHELQRNMNIDAFRLRNCQFLEMQRTMNADVLRTRNMQLLEMAVLPQDYAVNITDLLTKDEWGNIISDFLRGEIIQFEAIIVNTGKIWLENGLISIVISDPSAEPVMLAYYFGTIKSGEIHQCIFGWRIPFSSAAGVYTAKVMIFTNWPSKGGVGLTFKQVQFRVS